MDDGQELSECQVASEDPEHSLPVKGRRIIHVDMDAFYASVEILDNPTLAGQAIAVGGAKGRGVITTASYEARRFGVRSAMPGFKARELCPHLVFVKTRFPRYREISTAVREIFGRYTDLIEPLSLDEAYLDVTNHEDLAVTIAKSIRAAIKTEIGITASAGIGPNKMIAKIASDMRKPDGQTVVAPHMVEEFMAPLPVAKIPGVGPVSVKRLRNHNIVVCRDLWDLGRIAAGDLLSNYGLWLYDRSRGLDDRPVRLRQGRKTIGHESTFSTNLKHRRDMEERLRHIAEQVAATMADKNRAGRRITLKVRYPDFTRSTRAMMLPTPTASAEIIYQAAVSLLSRTAAQDRQVRLLGIAMGALTERSEATTYQQLALF